MRIKLFTVQGFANLTDPLMFGQLEDINAIYGPNNCGKSNLLNAMDLYFRLLGAGEGVTRAQTQILDAPDETLQRAIQQGLTRGDNQPIQFDVEWAIRSQDLEKYGLFPESPCGHVRTLLELKSMNRTYEVRIKQWMLEDKDISILDRGRDSAKVIFGQQVRRMLADAKPFKYDRPVHPVAYLGRGSEAFSQRLRDALFDARQSVDAEQRRRWALFSDLASCVSTELGEGTWQTFFERETGRADVVYIQGDEVVTLDMMGSGLQRLVGLLGEIALAPEPWICLEEPEWRLSPELQKRFISLARRAIYSTMGVTQIFITTHSPALASKCAAFAMDPTDTGPQIVRKAWEAGFEAGEEGMRQDPEAMLSSLIGLVDELAEMDEAQLFAQAQTIAPEPAVATPGPFTPRTPATTY